MSKIEKRGNISIIDNEYVLKREDDLESLEKYLSSRGINTFIPILNREDGVNKYEYINEIDFKKESLGEDIASNLSLLHNKTSYNKTVNLDHQKEIYENLNGYINYLSEYYLKIIKEIEFRDFPSPSEILFLSNYTKINEALFFTKNELNNWYNLVKEKEKTRVSLIHGNMKLDHVILGDRMYFTSWRNHRFDSPIIDLIDFYHNEWNNLEFSSILKKYFDKTTLLDEEKKLFFINISLPLKIEFEDDEFNNVLKVENLFDYLYKTESLIRPYYTVENKE